MGERGGRREGGREGGREGEIGEERNGWRGRERRGRGVREAVVYEDTVHITALIIHLSLTITPDTHTCTVFLMSELDPLFKEGDAGTSFPQFTDQIQLDTIGYHWTPSKIKSV